MKKYYLFLDISTFFKGNEYEKRKVFNWYTLDQLKYQDRFKVFREELATRNIADVVIAGTFNLYDYDNLYDMYIEPSHFEDGLEYHLVLSEDELRELQEIANLEFPTNERY